MQKHLTKGVAESHRKVLDHGLEQQVARLI